MFEVRVNRSRFAAAMSMARVVYHTTVFNLRKTHTNAIAGLFMNAVQSLIMIAVMFLMMSVMGMRAMAIRGDFLLYIMSGVLLFMTNMKTMTAVSGASTSSSAMMLHSPLNPLVTILAAALSSLYIQLLSAFVLLVVYGLAVHPVVADDPVGAFMMLMLSWYNGIAVGVIFLAIKPWFPRVFTLINTMYMRVNMIASGKMFTANSLPSFMLVMFSWNPLFHMIDQCRGYAFINYSPHHTSWQYPFIVSTVLLFVGLMGESYTRRFVSTSWSAR